MTDPALIEALRLLGDTYGPKGVADAAARLVAIDHDDVVRAPLAEYTLAAEELK